MTFSVNVQGANAVGIGTSGGGFWASHAISSMPCLVRALTIARQNEAVQQQQAELLSSTPKEAVNLDALNVRRSRPAKDPVATPPPTTHHPRRFKKSCGWCGKERHARAICLAKDCVCQKCREKGHFSTICRSANALRNIEQEPGFLGLMATTASSKWEVSPLVESQTLVFKIDTGADETVIPERRFPRLCKHVVLNSPDRRLQGPDGKTLRISGLARLHFKLKGRESMENVNILPGLRTALLGKPAITNLGLFPGEPLLEPSVSWLTDGEFFRTTSALERPSAADTETRLENSEESRAAVRGASIAQQHRPSEQQHRPSRMRQFSDYTPSNEVLLPDPTATAKKQERGDARRKSNDDTRGGDSLHQGDTDEKRHDTKSIASLRLRRPT
ncbi:hypothetical protein HPB48_022377 [Haemaphysalis longicornis]|uniref:Peptidase A2 domain-containing protein n=1 Tax=Haemaphysalis longicornis TaxID=44386 RepID=A0A9J6FA11_HAELO|nr:hypothetical protein HPB48_022377 [Haemaphysalis longicornis]